VVSKLHNATGIAVENEDHSTPNLGGWHCHICIPELGFKAKRSSSKGIAAGSTVGGAKPKQPRKLAAF
jgi:hypothetical protein